MKLKASLLEDYVNLVDTRTKQNAYFKRVVFLIATITSLFLVSLWSKYPNE